MNIVHADHYITGDGPGYEYFHHESRSWDNKVNKFIFKVGGSFWNIVELSTLGRTVLSYGDVISILYIDD